MRKNSKDQLPLNPVWPAHGLAKELRMTSRTLDALPEIPQWIMQDFPEGAKKGRGASGLSAELRCAVLKNGFSCCGLACRLSGSCRLQAFCRIPFSWKSLEGPAFRRASTASGPRGGRRRTGRWCSGRPGRSWRRAGRCGGDSTAAASPSVRRGAGCRPPAQRAAPRGAGGPSAARSCARIC